MYYSVSVDHNSIAAHLPDVIVKGFKMCCISSSLGVTELDVLWNDSKEVGSEWRRMKALTWKVEKVTLIGKFE